LKVSRELRAHVARRAHFRCEYCLIHEDDAAFAHEVDHVISQQHGGKTTEDNLAFACMICNRFKGTNIWSVNHGGSIIPLFNPRLGDWKHNFRLGGAVIEPLTATGEVTATLLKFNSAKRVIEREMLQGLGRYPRG